MPIGADPRNTTSIDRTPASPNQRNANQWWKTDDLTKVHERLWAVVERIRDNNARRSRLNYLHLLMYDDIDINQYIARGWSTGALNMRCTLNVVRAGIDTAASMIAKNQPKPMVLTDGADDYKKQTQAKRLSRYLGAVMEDSGVYQVSESVFTDACIFGLGAWFLYADDAAGKVRAERCFIEEILVDEMQGLRQTPGELHRYKWASRDQIIENYIGDSERAEELKKAVLDAGSDYDQNNTIADDIAIVESWHLPSSADADDGYHAICIKSATLLFEPYRKPFYPIVCFRWMNKPLGFYGRGIAQEIGPIQRDINFLTRTIADSQRAVGAPVIFVEKGSMVDDGELLTNEIGRQINYVGQMPQFATPPSCAPELYSHLQFLQSEAFQQIGINQNIAQGQKPDLGPEASGAAIRETTDIASGRLQNIAKRWEDTFTTLARLEIDISKDMAERKTLRPIQVTQRGSTESIDFAEIELEEADLKIDIFQVSGLPSSPAGKLQAVTEMAKAGWLSREESMILLDWPDLRATTDLETSTYDEVFKQISRIKESDIYTPRMKPCAEMDLQQALGLAYKHKVLAKREECSEDVLEKIDLYITDLKQLVDASQPPPPPPPPMAPPGAAGPPGAPPGPPAPPAPPGAQ